jgi:tetratricopeptide (TPR) repeat protein/KaiC/GvpD/RAD55 family RecA-like ATPase
VNLLAIKTLAEPTLIGREQELRELENYLQFATNGNGLTVFLSGEAGAGKTRLVTAFLQSANRAGATVLGGGCLGNVNVPYFPFIQAFDTYFGVIQEEESTGGFQQPYIKSSINMPINSPVASNIIQWLSGSQTQMVNEPMSPQVWRDKTFVAIANTLHQISQNAPMILLLEDIHWADSATLGLLHYISKVISNQRILILATYRSEELTVDKEGRPHPLIESLQLMKRENVIKEILLKSLDSQEVYKIAESMIQGKIDPSLATRIAIESQGNPLFVVETLKMLKEKQALVFQDSTWQLGTQQIGIPSKIKEIILSRVAPLKLSERRILNAASVIGDKFDIELLATVLKQDTLDILEDLNLIALSTGLVNSKQDIFSFDHSKSREALYEDIPLPLRKGYHARIAEKLEANNNNGRKRNSEIAYHYSQAGNDQKTLVYSMEAGKDALARFSNTEALLHFKTVLNLIGESSQFANEKLAALEALGDAYSANSMFEEAKKTYELLASLATGGITQRAYNKAILATLVRASDDSFIKLIQKASQVPAVDPFEAAKLTYQKGFLLWGAGKLEEALEICKGAVKMLEDQYRLWDVAQSLSGVAIIYLLNNKLEEGIAAYLRSNELAAELGDYLLQENNYQGSGQLCIVNCGTVEEGKALLLKAIKIAEKMADYNKLAETTTVLSWAYEAESDFRTAIKNTLKAEVYAKKTDSQRVLAMVYSGLTREYVMAGDLEKAEYYCNKLLSFPEPILAIPGPQGYQSVAVFMTAKGKLKEAGEYFEKQNQLRKLRTPGTEVRFRRYFAAYLEKLGRIEEANKLRQEANEIWKKLAERFDHADLQANMLTPTKIEVNHTFEARLYLSNPSRTQYRVLTLQELVPSGLVIEKTTPQTINAAQGMELAEPMVEPFSAKTIKMTLRAPAIGTYNFAPKATYTDNMEQTRTCTAPTVTITVSTTRPNHEIAPDRVTTGTQELDELFLGGLPQGSSIVLSAPASEEREQIIRSYLIISSHEGQQSLLIACDANTVEELAGIPKIFCISCNQQTSPASSNVFKVEGIDSLTNIDIALTKYLRQVNQTGKPQRACIQILSDVLLQHHAQLTRKWLTALLSNLKSKGFTVLATIDPTMHPADEVQAILSLFDGEIQVIEKETGEGLQRLIRIRRFYGHKYNDKKLVLKNIA